MTNRTPRDRATRRRSVTLDHVAQVAGVSRATVSRVVNGSPAVAPAIRRAVEKAIAETNYVPNRAARSLVTRTTDSIALLVSEPNDPSGGVPFVGRVFNDPHFGRIASGLLAMLRPRGIQLVLMVANDEESRTQVLHYLRSGHVDGVVLLSNRSSDPLPAVLAEEGIPVVLSARPPTPLPIGYVEADQRAGVALAVDRLVGLGRRRIATITGPLDEPPGHERLDAFRESLRRHGLTEAGVAEGHFTQIGGVRAMRDLLDTAPEMDGVFIASDLMALGAMPVLQQHGCRVPEDIAVIGFDDSNAALACEPPLTTVRQPVEEMSGRMAELLLAQIDAPDAAVQSSWFTPSLVIRDSA
jgi:DNA-binding LacI/PurR family transcriptional regulator